MALIKCPECGGKLSDSVKKCIHCNTKITICPECGMVFAEDSISCPECGFSFKNDGDEKDNFTECHESLDEKENKEETIASNIIEKNTSEKIVDSWKRESPLRKIYTESVVSAIAWLIIIALVVMIGINFIDWQQIRVVNGDPLVEADSYLNLVGSAEDVFSKIRTCILICIIMSFVVSIYENAKKHLSIKDYWNWTVSKSLDLCSIVHNDFSLDFNSMSETNKKYVSLSLETHMYDDNLETRKTYTTKNVVYILNEILSSLFFGFLSIQFLEYAMKLVIDGKINNFFAFDEIDKVIDCLFVFASEHWFAVSILIVLSIIEPILKRYFDNKLEKMRINWITLNIPEGKDIYQNHLKKNKFI